MPKTAILDKNKLYPKAVCQQNKEPAAIIFFGHFSYSIAATL